MISKRRNDAELARLAQGLSPNAQILLGYLHAQRERTVGELGRLERAADELCKHGMAYIDNSWIYILPRGDEIMQHAPVFAVEPAVALEEHRAGVAKAGAPAAEVAYVVWGCDSTIGHWIIGVWKDEARAREGAWKHARAGVREHSLDEYPRERRASGPSRVLEIEYGPQEAWIEVQRVEVQR
jgi:hypothetical protein